MGRRPKPENRWLREAGLKYVTVSKGRYVYKPYLGKGRYGKEVPLCSIDSTRRQVMERYEEATTGPRDTLGWMLRYYLDRVQGLAVRTRTDYERYERTICAFEGFGNAKLARITRRSMRSYLDSYPAPVMANRHVQFIKAAWNWVLDRHDLPDNPCVDVKLNKETPRDRYVNDSEYKALLQIAQAQATPYLAIAMELAYLCRARRGEVLSLRRECLTPEGILLERGKGSRGEITLWTPRLTEVAQQAQTLHPETISPWLLYNKDGSAIRGRQLEQAWKRAMKKAIAQGVEPFTFHDIKAKGITDHPKKHGGHKSEKMQAVYDRLPENVESTK